MRQKGPERAWERLSGRIETPNLIRRRGIGLRLRILWGGGGKRTPMTCGTRSISFSLQIADVGAMQSMYFILVPSNSSYFDAHTVSLGNSSFIP